jgi:purine-binding chemotaxis protein CheW
METKRGERAKTEDELRQVCSVRLGERLFGVPIRPILEIVGAVRPRPVPLAREFVGGLVHYRGDVLTTVSLRRLLELPPRDTSQDLLVIEGADGCFGLLVDKVMEVTRVSEADYEPNPSTVEERRKSIFAGAYKLKQGLMVMLDPQQLDPMKLARAG